MVVLETQKKNKVSIGVLLWSYIRAWIQVLVLGLYTCFGGLFLVIEANLIGFRPIEDWILQNWAWTQLWVAGVDLIVRGAENIPREGCLFLFNHMSYADIYATFGGIPRPFRFGAKIELFSVPIFGWTMRNVGILPIVRNNREEVLKVYAAAVARVKTGECFALAPEGTRQTEPVLAPFKLGPFIFAVNAQMPLVPVIIAGTHQVQPKGAWLMNVGASRRTVIVEILPPISTAGLQTDQVKALSERTRAVMVQHHDRLFREI
jgi:1-acyl-sn-glycerol-3-phosphate acyltransferase